MNAPASGKATAPALADFILLNQEIAALVRARLPLESHLAQIGVELPGKAGELAERIGQRLAAGESFSAAFESECGSMPAVYRATIEAGVESGHLGDAVESLVDTATRMDQLRRVTGLAILYPIVLIMTASMLFAFVLTKVVPQFGWLKHSPVAPLMSLSHSPRAVLWTGLAVPGIAIFVALVWWWRSGRMGRATAGRFGWMAWLPGTRTVHRWSQAATFSELLLLMVERGVPFSRALRLTAESIDDAGLRRAAERVADHAELGGEVAGSEAKKELPEVVELPLLIRLALHHTGNRDLMASSLRQAAVIYRERAARAADWYSEYMPILLTVGIGGTLTIIFTLLVLWPYAAMLHELAR